ncbi:TauD/TfdA family dioxygenase (plasmid) [Sphaerotilaceae bacterium SBD11-9]
MNDLSRAGVVTLSEDAGKALRVSSASLLEVVASFHKCPGDYTKLGPLENHQAQKLRSELFKAGPGLEDLSAALQRAQQRATAVLIPKVGLSGFSVGERATLVYALAVGLGNPTATDQKQVVWDVKPRLRDSTYFSTFSETDGEAAYHTDTQYFPEPEANFILYCMQEARCGGGYSSVLDARALRSDIEAKSPQLAQALAQGRFPFRVPSAFVRGGDRDVIEATLAPIFADEPLIRYRRDTLLEGALHFPRQLDADGHKALDAFEAELAACTHQAEFFMPSDSLVYIDNHRALHARTSFQDHERHLLRIRMRDDSRVKRPSGLSMVRCRAQTLQSVT